MTRAEQFNPDHMMLAAPNLVAVTPLALSVIVPTFNEQKNVASMIAALGRVLKDYAFEVIFVDDHSPDGTAAEVRRFAAQSRHVRCIERVGRRGLSGAVIEGAFAASAPLIAVIDGDMQHDEAVLTGMLDAMEDPSVDLVVGTRYAGAGSVGDWDETRARASRFATNLAQKMTGVTLSDPMAGFFMTRADLFRAQVDRLSPNGFKILLDYVSSCDRRLNVVELPYEFRTRTEGDSKMDAKVLLDFAELLIDKSIGRYIPTKFVMFSMVGGFGVGVHFFALFMLLNLWGFTVSQLGATMVAMTTNFALNNAFTHRDKQLRGWRWLRGWASFALVSAIGATANVGVATYLFQQQGAAWYVSALAGISMSVVWNYAVSSIYTWGGK